MDSGMIFRRVPCSFNLLSASGKSPVLERRVRDTAHNTVVLKPASKYRSGRDTSSGFRDSRVSCCVLRSIRGRPHRPGAMCGLKCGLLYGKLR